MRAFCWHRGHGMIWFRVFGWGLVIKDNRIHRPLFSERNGITFWLPLGPYRLRHLVPGRGSQ